MNIAFSRYLIHFLLYFTRDLFSKLSSYNIFSMLNFSFLLSFLFFFHFKLEVFYGLDVGIEILRNHPKLVSRQMGTLVGR